MHQKITSLLAALLAAVLLCACGGQPAQAPEPPEVPEEDAPYDLHWTITAAHRWWSGRSASIWWRRPGW